MLLVDLLSYGFHIGLSYGDVSLEAERARSATGAELLKTYDLATDLHTTAVPRQVASAGASPPQLGLQSVPESFPPGVSLAGVDEARWTRLQVQPHACACPRQACLAWRECRSVWVSSDQLSGGADHCRRRPRARHRSFAALVQTVAGPMGQPWRACPPWGSARLGGDLCPRVHDTRWPPRPDVAPARRAGGQRAASGGLVDAGEAWGEVGLQHPVGVRGAEDREGAHRLPRGASRSQASAVGRKAGFPMGFSRPRDPGWQGSIRPGRETHGPPLRRVRWGPPPPPPGSPLGGPGLQHASRQGADDGARATKWGSVPALLARTHHPRARLPAAGVPSRPRLASTRVPRVWAPTRALTLQTLGLTSASPVAFPQAGAAGALRPRVVAGGPRRTDADGAVVSTAQADPGPALRWPRAVGRHASPAVSGVSPGRWQSRPALRLALFAHAHTPRRLAPSPTRPTWRRRPVPRQLGSTGFPVGCRVPPLAPRLGA